MGEPVKLKGCPWCNSAEHLSVQSIGSLTPDMPARPYRIVCSHIDHDTVTGPVAYGRGAAMIAWNTRPSPSEGEVERVARAICADHYSERFGKPVDDPHVLSNVESNWRLWEREARSAIAAMSGEG